MDVVGILRGLTGLLLLFGVLPVGIGGFFAGTMKRLENTSLFFCYMIGFMISLALSEVLAVPMTLLKSDFRLFVVVYSILLAALFLLGGAIGRRQIRESIKDAWNRCGQVDAKRVMIVLAVGIPVFVLLFYTPHIYGDDKTYITMVNDILTTNELYLTDAATGAKTNYISGKYSLSVYWTWVAYLARVTGIHPLILCKTILGILYVPMSYAIQGMLADFLFYGDKRKKDIFLLLVVLVCLFGGFSGYTITFRIYTWVWQSKALLAIIVLPFLMYYCNLIYSAKAGIREYFLLFVMNIATCSTSMMGSGLTVAMVCMTALFYAVRKRSPAILLGTIPTCAPALLLMVAYMRYGAVLQLFHF